MIESADNQWIILKSIIHLQEHDNNNKVLETVLHSILESINTEVVEMSIMMIQHLLEEINLAKNQIML